jgi:hypothetical protein
MSKIPPAAPRLSDSEWQQCVNLIEDDVGRKKLDTVSDIPKTAANRARCVRAVFTLNSGEYFKITTGKHPVSARVVTDPYELTKDPGTYRLLRYYYKAIRHVDNAQRWIIQSIEHLDNTYDRLEVYFAPGTHWTENARAYFLPLRNSRRLPLGLRFNAKTVTSNRRQTIGHELGHAYMFVAYGRQLPNYEGHRGHDMTSQGDAYDQTNPGAAWSEGFAQSMGALGHYSSRTPESFTTQRPRWMTLPLHMRLSNEHVICAVLYDLMHSMDLIPRGNFLTWELQTHHDQYVKVTATLHRAGLQQSFAEFVEDFLHLYPEERKALTRSLKKYGMADVIGTVPNYKERRILRFVDAMNSMVGIVTRDLARNKAWATLTTEHGIDKALLDRSKPIQARLKLMAKAKRYIARAAKRAWDPKPPFTSKPCNNWLGGCWYN